MIELVRKKLFMKQGRAFLAIIVFGLVLCSLFLFKISADTISTGQIQITVGSLMDGTRKGTNLVSVNLPRGETQDVVLDLKNLSSVDFDSLTIQKANINNGSGLIFPSQNIDDRIVYSWPQKIIDPTGESSPVVASVDELLVKTNKINYLGPEITSSNLPNSSGYMPTQPNGSSDFILNHGGQQKVVLRITAPATAGIYSGKIIVYDTKHNVPVGSIKIQINATSVKLVQPIDQGYSTGCFINDRLLASGATVPSGLGMYYENQDLFTKRMRIAYDAGCESAVLKVSPATDYISELKIIQKIGFKGKMILNFSSVNSANTEIKYDTLRTSLAQAQFKKLLTDIASDSEIKIPIEFYGLDEPNSPDPSQSNSYANNLVRIANIKQVIDEVASSMPLHSIQNDVTSAMLPDTYLKLNSSPTDATNSPILNYWAQCSRLAIPGFVCTTDTPQMFDKFKSGEINQPPEAAYYFQGSIEQPTQNRYLGGLGLIFSGVKGYYLNPIWGFYANSDSLFGESTLPQTKKQNMTFYPASDGLIPTVQSEAWHEGVMDIKYYLTYQKDKELVNSSCKGNSDQQYLQTLGESIDSGSESMASLSYGLPDFNLDELRTKLESYVYYFEHKCNGSAGSTNLSFDFPNGFTSLGSSSNISLDDLTSQGLSVFLFNDLVSQDWTRYSGSQGSTTIPAGRGFYVYNPDSSKHVTVSTQASSDNTGVIKPGWNLLWSQASQKAGDVNLKVQIDPGKCYSANLSTLINSNLVSNLVYIVDQDQYDSNHPADCQVFKLLSDSITSYPCTAENAQLSTIDIIPTNKDFWVYLWPNKLDQIAANSTGNCD
jgi:hypothetical protein